jgi:hypothetical protein
MFKKNFKPITTESTTSKNKNITFKFLLNEILNNIQVFIMNFFKKNTPKNTPKNNPKNKNTNLSAAEKELKFFKNLRRKQHSLLNRRLFASKEELLESFNTYNFFFKHE